MKNMPAFSKAKIEKIWIPRAELLESFLQKIRKSKNIQILFSSSCDEINITDDKVTVVIKSDNNGHLKKLSPCLLLGCDGINSVVRTWLSKSENSDSSKKSAKNNRFNPISVPSDAAGLKYKMLTLKNK